MECSRIRNIVVMGHLSSGKTTLVEALYSETNNKEMGSIERKNTISDSSELEHIRQSSVKSAIVPIEYNGYKFNLIDVPGSDDFIGEAISSVSIVKGAVLVVDATKGVEVGTIRHYNMLKKRGIPTIIYLNKMDKDGIDFDKCLSDIRAKFGKNAIPFCYPLGHDSSFDGFANCVTLKARVYNGKTCEDAEIYSDKKSKVFELHNTMVEAVAETSEELMDKFFSGEQLTHEEIQKGLRQGVLDGSLIPVLVGSATKKIGIHTMLDMFIDYLPSPSDLKSIVVENDSELIEVKTKEEEPFSAIVFKTVVDPYAGVLSYIKVNSGVLKSGDSVLNSSTGEAITIKDIYTPLGSKLNTVNSVSAGDIAVIAKVSGLLTSMTLCDPKRKVIFDNIEFPTAVYFKALLPKTKSDDDKLSGVLQKLKLEDQTIEIKRNVETNQLLIGTQGQGHLTYILDYLKSVYKLDLNTEDYKVVYRETITKTASAEGRYVKQSGGSGFYGVVVMEFMPAEESVFTEEVFGGAVPKNYFPAVEKGFYEALEKGLLLGYPVIGVKAILKDGKYHPVDSNELAFKMAAILAFKEAYNNANPVLLEPIIKVTVTIPSDVVGDVLSDLNQRRAKIIGMDINSNNLQKIEALVPEVEILEYVNDLKSITQGEGYFNRVFNSYERVPEHIASKLLNK